MSAYRRNLYELFETCRRVLKPTTLFIWTTALPVSESVRGGVILDTIRFMQDVLRYDVLMANDIGSRAAVTYRFDVVDLHFEMRRHIDMRLPDGIHWNSQAHRKITSIILHHICIAWHVVLPPRVGLRFDRLLCTSSYASSKKSTDSLLETAAGEGSSRVDSEWQREPSGFGNGLLPPLESHQSLAHRGRQRFRRVGNRALSAPSMSVTRN